MPTLKITCQDNMLTCHVTEIAKTKLQCCKYGFLEWLVTFLSEHSKDDWDQGTGEPTLKTPNEGPGSKL